MKRSRPQLREVPVDFPKGGLDVCGGGSKVTLRNKRKRAQVCSYHLSGTWDLQKLEITW